MPAVPQTDVRARIIAAAVGSPALGASDVFIGLEVPTAAEEGAGTVPDRAVFVRDLPGAEPRRLHDGDSHHQASVLVTVRSPKDSYAAGVALAELVRAALEKSTLSADYLEQGCEAAQDRMGYAGTDELGRHRWSCAFTCHYVAA